MRKFRAIVETNIEPEDHNVLWYWKGKLLYWGNDAWEPFLLVDAIEIPYKTEEDESITTVQGALDKLLYVYPKITSFTLEQPNTYEKGSVVNTLDFSWSYNKESILFLSLSSLLVGSLLTDIIRIPPSMREARLTRNINKDTKFTLTGRDRANFTSADISIKFVDYIYYGTEDSDGVSIKRDKINPSIKEFTVTANKGEYIWVFIPGTSGLTHIWHDNINSTEDFTATRVVGFLTDTGLKVLGTYYVSKNHGLGNVTLKLT